MPQFASLLFGWLLVGGARASTPRAACVVVDPDHGDSEAWRFAFAIQSQKAGLDLSWQAATCEADAVEITVDGDVATWWTPHGELAEVVLEGIEPEAQPRLVALTFVELARRRPEVTLVATDAPIASLVGSEPGRSRGWLRLGGGLSTTRGSTAAGGGLGLELGVAFSRVPLLLSAGIAVHQEALSVTGLESRECDEAFDLALRECLSDGGDERSCGLRAEAALESCQTPEPVSATLRPLELMATLRFPLRRARFLLRPGLGVGWRATFGREFERSGWVFAAHADAGWRLSRRWTVTAGPQARLRPTVDRARWQWGGQVGLEVTPWR
ncbi:MAG: hypothetical protein AAF602_04580 [Myxococcota bacterium]